MFDGILLLFSCHLSTGQVMSKFTIKYRFKTANNCAIYFRRLLIICCCLTCNFQIYHHISITGSQFQASDFHKRVFFHYFILKFIPLKFTKKHHFMATYLYALSIDIVEHFLHFQTNHLLCRPGNLIFTRKWFNISMTCCWASPDIGRKWRRELHYLECFATRENNLLVIWLKDGIICNSEEAGRKLF